MEPVYFRGRALFRRAASCPALPAELVTFDFAPRSGSELEHCASRICDRRVHILLDARARTTRRSVFPCQRSNHVWWRAFHAHFCRTSPAFAGDDMAAADFLRDRWTVYTSYHRLVLARDLW